MRRLTLFLICHLLLSGHLAWAEESAASHALHAWLIHQRHPATGLVQSFETSDPALRFQASTYDQALAGMALLVTNDPAAARNILAFFHARWNGTGFSNFYHTKTGQVGIETTIHAGPNAWIGLLALAYEARTGDAGYRPLAESIAVWIAGLNHRAGGVAMGPRADWGANWPSVYSSENNLSYLALLDGLLALHGADLSHTPLFQVERTGVLQFLRTVTFRDLAQGRINSGLNDRGVDTTQSFDIIPMALLIVGSSRLHAMGVDPLALIQCGEQRFSIEHHAIHGFDFTDQAGAAGAKRGRMISVEWTAMMIRAYRHVAEDIAGATSQPTDASAAAQARALLLQAAMLAQGLDQLAMRPTPEDVCYPYATRSGTQVFPFAPWWKTPAPGPTGLACSVAGTTWRYFAEHGDPFQWN